MRLADEWLICGGGRNMRLRRHFSLYAALAVVATVRDRLERGNE